MNAWRLEAILVVATLGFITVAVARWRSAVPGDPGSGSSRTVAPGVVSPVDRRALDKSANAAKDLDPFRLSRRPAEVAYLPRSATASAISTTPPFRGPLHLRGIVGGPPWQAIVDGLPGQPPGTVVSAGKTFDKIVVRSISRDTVIIQAPDTIWRLTLTKGGQ
jgi:hypothetical protein